MSSKKEVNWHNRKLQESVKENVTKFFEMVLDFSEVAVGDEHRYKALRSKVLRHGNDTIRKIMSEIEKDYDVVYKKVSTDVVKVVNNK